MIACGPSGENGESAEQNTDAASRTNTEGVDIPEEYRDMPIREPVTDQDADVPHLVFYALPNCPKCMRTKQNIDRLRPRYIGDVRMDYIDINTSEGREGQEKYGFNTGMVLMKPDGTVYWKEEGLAFRLDQIRKKLDGLLEELEQDESETSAADRGEE